MNQALATEADPDARPVDPDQRRAAASRGLMLVALLVIIVPAAIGVFILRSGSTPAPPGISDAIPFIPPGDTGGDEGPTSADLLQPGNTATESNRLRYLADGDPAGLANGGVIDLSDGTRLQVWVSPYPPTEFSTDIEFLLTDANGEPVTDAVIEAEWDMIMVHGPFQSTFRHTAAGKYQTGTFDFFMFGPWQLAMTIDRPAGSVSVKLAVYVWPD